MEIVVNSPFLLHNRILLIRIHPYSKLICQWMIWYWWFPFARLLGTPRSWFFSGDGIFAGSLFLLQGPLALTVFFYQMEWGLGRQSSSYKILWHSTILDLHFQNSFRNGLVSVYWEYLPKDTVSLS